jgi:hypothetical protein
VPPAADYIVQIDARAPLHMHAQLDIDASVGRERVAQVRGTQFGLRSQVASPRCGEEALEAVDEGQWRVPPTCRRLQWTIVVDAASPSAVDASGQRTLHFADRGWWLLSEPTSLLRIDHVDAPGELTLQILAADREIEQIGATAVDGGHWRVPPPSSAPEFYAVGNLELQSHGIGPLQATYVIDDPQRFARLPLPALHAAALGHLAAVYGVPDALPPRDRHLLVIWLGIDEALGEAGGAAGSRSFIANYIDGDDEALLLNAARTLMVLAHEQSHQLHDLMWRGGAPVPTWLAESLAQHHGLQALTRSGLPDAVVAVARDAFVDTSRPVQYGLVAWQRRHEQGDPEAYAMFYLQGATFWAEIERALRQADADSGIDALMPVLLAGDDQGDSSSALPPAFAAALVERGGDQVAELIERYVGR